MVGLWVVKAMHSKVGVNLLVVYLFWCCVSLWLSSKLSTVVLTRLILDRRVGIGVCTTKLRGF